jgi:hypothetical protein
MMMTLQELAAHAADMTGLLEAKRRQIQDATDLSPRCRASLTVQIDALAGRIEQLSRQCDLLDPGADTPTLQLQSVAPGLGPPPRVVA